jgi:hypothetical protein
MPKSDIVFGSEFSPAVIDLPELLSLVGMHSPSRAALQNAIDERFFRGKGKNADPKKTLGDNTILAMTAYGLIERKNKDTVEFTKFGQELYDNRTDLPELKRLMGRHCLAHLDGLRVVSSIHDLISANIPLKKESLAKRLREQGLHVPSNGKHLNMLRQWLQFAGVLNSTGATGGDALWMPDEERIKELLGVTTSDIERWGELTRPQYDFARAFALMGANEAPSSEVRDIAVSLYGTEFPEGGLPKSVLHHLEEVGLIEWKKTTGGRGAKAHQVFSTDKLLSEFLPPILTGLANDAVPDRHRFAAKPLAVILQELNSRDCRSTTTALEALAFFFCRRIDLTVTQWTSRPGAEGGAEVDAVVEGGLICNRWLVRCKKTRRLDADHILSAVGTAYKTRSKVILLASNGKIDLEAQYYVARITHGLPLRIICIGRPDLQNIAGRRWRLLDFLRIADRDALARVA